MGDLVRRNLRFFLIFSAAALLLRLIFIFRFPGVVTDSFVYGDIAKNWLLHGIYGLSGTDEISPTYIRLPGYPAFLALIFWIAGMEHYRAVLIVQMIVDLGTCFLCADIALRLVGARTAKATFVLACLCPFLADYSAAALTETLEVFFTALTLDLTIRGLQGSKLSHWIGAGLACAATILLRPDGILLLVAIECYLLVFVFVARKRGRGSAGIPARQSALPGWRGDMGVPPVDRWKSRFTLARSGVLFATLAVAPLVPWTIRNWRVFHKIQPLAPRYANEENEFVPLGFNRWVKTWIADYTSVEEIYWQEPGDSIDSTKLPSRAFDTSQQQAETVALINDYNALLHIPPELDARFEALASTRIHAHHARYYVALPALRIMDMWLRPRTEMLPCDSRWWEFSDEPKWSVLAISLGLINLVYIACAMIGWLRVRTVPLTGLLVLFVLLRSLFLGTLENPEPRYTLEMYPVVIFFAACALARIRAESNEQMHDPRAI